MTNNQKALIRTLLYFDIFHYPLEKAELFGLSKANEDLNEFETDIDFLLGKELIYSDSGFYQVVDKKVPFYGRSANSKRICKYYKIANFISSIIFSHPFVRSVMISGSLSKMAISKKDDIDYFIIAEPGRIWICRALLMLFKKVFLLNSKKYFCINYYIDSQSLEIDEKNIFTATELAFLIPMKNPELYKKFLDANLWIRSFFPKLHLRDFPCSRIGKHPMKTLFEKVLGGKTGDKLDSFFMDLYIKRTAKKYGETDPDNVNIKSEKNVAKFHPNGYQHLILEQYSLKITEFEKSHKVDLTM